MKNIINYGDRRFVLIRTLREEDKPIVDTWREHLRADTVLKKNGLLYFCQEILNAEILEEWTETDSEKWLKEHKKEK